MVMHCVSLSRGIAPNTAIVAEKIEVSTKEHCHLADDTHSHVLRSSDGSRSGSEQLPESEVSPVRNDSTLVPSPYAIPKTPPLPPAEIFPTLEPAGHNIDPLSPNDARRRLPTFFTGNTPSTSLNTSGTLRESRTPPLPLRILL